MISRDEFNEIKETVEKHKSRTLMTVFGVFWGILMLMLLLGSGNGLENGITNMFKGYALSSYHFYSGVTKIPFDGIKENRRIHYTDEDLNLLKSHFKDDISYAGARSYTPNNVSVNLGEITANSKVYGLDPNMQFIRNVKIEKGRYINARDIEEIRSVIILGTDLKELLFENRQAIGQFIQIKSNFYKVIGIFSSVKEGEEADQENRSSIIPHNTFQKNFDRGSKIDNIAVVSFKKNLESKILEFLRGRHYVSPEDDEAVRSWNTKKEYSKFQNLFKAIRIFMWVIGIGTLLSGIVGVSNIMVINIKERTKEIGIRKAIGATPFMIVKVIILESVIITSFSGYLGISVGILIIEGINKALNTFNMKSEFFMNPEINGFVIITAFLTLITSGFLAAYFPAKKAANIKPIDALRTE